MDTYKLDIAPNASQSLHEITSKKTYLAMKKRILALKTFPKMGPIYDPAYPSSIPPHQMRVTYVDHYGIYYTIYETTRLVNVEYIEDSYKNPFNKFRFTEIPPSEA